MELKSTVYQPSNSYLCHDLFNNIEYFVNCLCWDLMEFQKPKAIDVEEFATHWSAVRFIIITI